MRTTNKMKNYLKIGVLLFSTLLFLTNCEDNFDEPPVQQSSKVEINEISFETFSSKNKFKKITTSISKNNKLINTKNITSNDSSFTIVTDKVITATIDSIVNYTFEIINPNLPTGTFDNFIVTEVNNNQPYYSIYRYEESISNI